MSEDSIKVMEIKFKIAVRSLRFRLEEDYDTFYQKAPDSDRTDFCVKMLGIVPTHKEAGRYIVPKLLKVLDSINNGKLHTLLSNERNCRETNMLLQTEFCRSVTKIDYKGNLDFFINRDINIPESRTVLKDMFDLIVFVEAINRFIKIESIKPIFTGV